MAYTLSCFAEPQGGVTVLRAEGFLNDMTIEAFEACLSEVPTDAQVVLDCSQVVHISSIGFGTLLALASERRLAGGDIRLAGLRISLAKAVMLAFGEYFLIYPSVQSASASYAGAIAG